MDDNQSYEPITTKALYFKKSYVQKGSYFEERKALHKKIINNLLKDVRPAMATPLATFIGGGSGSGKSTVSKSLAEAYRFHNESFLHIDSDEIKKLLPEYEYLIKSNPENMAIILHDESSDIAELLYYEAINKNVNIVLDGTMKNVEKYLHYFIKARESHYKIEIAIVDVPVDEAIKRAEIRYEIEGRRVPDEIIFNSHQKVPNTFYKLKNFADACYLYDNSDIHPKQFYVKINNEVKVLDDSRLKQFYAKSEDLSHWVYLEEALKLKDILTLGHGVLLENERILQMLEYEVNTFHSVKGEEFHTFIYLHKESTTIQSIALCSPHVLNTIKDKLAFTDLANDEYELE